MAGITQNKQKTLASVAVAGLKVCGAAASGKNRWVKIPKAFSQDELQVDAKDIATPKKIAKWEYLDDILHEISQSSDVETGLLIGANRSKAWSQIKSSQAEMAGLMLSELFLDGVLLARCKKRLI